MLLTQKFHSLQEIDPEFVPAIESLMQEQWVNFSTWKEAETQGPANTMYIYWLFFGPTQNSPIGIAQVSLQKIDRLRLPWWKKLSGFFNKRSTLWKKAHWQLADGSHGGALFDPRFSRSGQLKLQELMNEVAARDDVQTMAVTSPNTVSHRPSWGKIEYEREHSWLVLCPWERRHKAYQDYLAELADTQQELIQLGWKKLHKDLSLTLGDYPDFSSRPELISQCPHFDEGLIAGLTGGILTFQKSDRVLGFIHYREGAPGVLFVTPVPLEQQGEELVSDLFYVQYALLKAHELVNVRRVIIHRHGSGVRLQNQAEAQFFEQQGLTTRQIFEVEWSRSPYVS